MSETIVEIFERKKKERKIELKRGLDLILELLEEPETLEKIKSIISKLDSKK